MRRERLGVAAGVALLLYLVFFRAGTFVLSVPHGKQRRLLRRGRAGRVRPDDVPRLLRVRGAGHRAPGRAGAVAVRQPDRGAGLTRRSCWVRHRAGCSTRWRRRWLLARWRLLAPAAFAMLVYAPYTLGDHKWPALLRASPALAVLSRTTRAGASSGRPPPGGERVLHAGPGRRVYRGAVAFLCGVARVRRRGRCSWRRPPVRPLIALLVLRWKAGPGHGGLRLGGLSADALPRAEPLPHHGRPVAAHTAARPGAARPGAARASRRGPRAAAGRDGAAGRAPGGAVPGWARSWPPRTAASTRSCLAVQSAVAGAAGRAPAGRARERRAHREAAAGAGRAGRDRGGHRRTGRSASSCGGSSSSRWCASSTARARSGPPTPCRSSSGSSRTRGPAMPRSSCRRAAATTSSRSTRDVTTFPYVIEGQHTVEQARAALAQIDGARPRVGLWDQRPWPRSAPRRGPAVAAVRGPAEELRRRAARPAACS